MFFVVEALSQLRQGVEGGEFKQGHALLKQVCFSITIEYLFCPRILAKGKPDHWGMCRSETLPRIISKFILRLRGLIFIHPANVRRVS